MKISLLFCVSLIVTSFPLFDYVSYHASFFLRAVLQHFLQHRHQLGIDLRILWLLPLKLRDRLCLVPASLGFARLFRFLKSLLEFAAFLSGCTH